LIAPSKQSSGQKKALRLPETRRVKNRGRAERMGATKGRRAWEGRVRRQGGKGDPNWCDW